MFGGRSPINRSSSANAYYRARREVKMQAKENTLVLKIITILLVLAAVISIFLYMAKP
jgi:hypothetical protein